MPRKRVINLKESLEKLRELERQYRRKPQVARIRALILLEEQPDLCIVDAAIRIGYAKQTLKRWLKIYREEGLSALLELPGAASRGAGPDDDVMLLKRKLQLGEFTSIDEIMAWGQERIEKRKSRRKRREGANAYKPATPPEGNHDVSERVVAFLSSLPLTNSVMDWTKALHSALQGLFRDVDRISLSVNVGCDLIHPEQYHPDLVVSQNVGFEQTIVTPVEIDPVAKRDTHMDRILQHLATNNFPFHTYHPPIGSEYLYPGGGFLGVIILWREAWRPAISTATVALFENLRRFWIYILSDFVARFQAAEPVSVNFDKLLKQFSDEAKLTMQERRVIVALLLGMNHDETAAMLHISVNTICYHLRSIYRKTETHSQAELFAKYFTPLIDLKRRPM